MVISDADFLALKARVANISNELGSDPSGVFTDIAQRVESIEQDVQDVIDDGPAPLLLFGDVTGNTNANTVIKLQGRDIDDTAPANDEVLTWDSGINKWKPAPGGGGGSFTAAGDLSGNSSSQTVIKVNGATTPVAGSLTTGNVLQVSGSSALSYGPLNLAGGVNYITGTLPNANLTDATTGVKGIVQLAGDLAGTATTVSVAKINGATVPSAGALTTGNVLQVSGVSAVSYGALNLAGGANYVTGILPAANHPDATTGVKGIIQLAGDLAGTSTAITVAKVNGTTVPAGGTLTTGNGLYVTGVGALSYGALNLAGGANYVSGILPVANLPDTTTGVKGVIQLAGDLAGTATSVTVAKVNGSTVPAGGALTVGNGLYVTGVGALSYSALNLAGGANYVSGILPAANHPDATTGAKGIVQLAGDLAGTSTSVTVSRINGSTVPAGGALTTGTVLRATGAATLGYGALDLANVSAVTGVLPCANLFQATTGTSGAVRLTGDLGGTGAAPTVVDLTITSEANGSTIYFNGTNWVNRAAGTANYVFTANGAAAPTWNNSISAMTDVRSQIFSLDPVSGTAGNARVFYDTFTTTSNTQYTARTISFAAGVSAVVTCCITGVDANTGGGGTNRVISITKSGKYYRAVAGSLQISGSSTVQDHTPTWGDNQTAIDLSFVVSSNDLQIKVTGQSTFNAKWSMETTVRLVLI